VTGPLQGLTVVNSGVNLPAVVASHRLGGFGAAVTKVEPPTGDPLASAAPALYAELTEDQEIRRLDLRDEMGRGELETLLAGTDALLTSSRPSALGRLGLDPAALRRHPRLVHVAIVGSPAPDQELAGHDLTYLAHHDLLDPPALPPTLIADLGGAERAVSTMLALLLGRERGSDRRHAEVALEDAARSFALPRRHGVTSPGGLLGGGDPAYGLYPAREGWVAVAALEPHFRQRLQGLLQLPTLEREHLARAFADRTADEWEAWAAAQDVPVAAVRSSSAG
jgi:crotonobetainyl-CoA:carnitine CoA-transferase CaiB-like acyl-CoA transferase